MATRRIAKPAAKAQQPEELTLYPALKFVTDALDSSRDFYLHHVMLYNGWCVGKDNLLTVGSPIREEIAAQPHAGKLLAAIERCNELPTFTQRDEFSITVKSGKFKANINCVDELLRLQMLPPDPKAAPLTDDFVTAIATVKHIPTVTADKAFKAGVCLLSGSVVGSDGIVMLEAWHGLKTPHVIIPRAAADAICKVKKKVSGIGATSASLTLHYEDGSFLKTQLYEDAYPDFQQIFDRYGANPVPLAEGFYEVLDKLKPFVDEDRSVIISDGNISTSLQKGVGAEYEIDLSMLAGGIRCFSLDYLLAIKDAFKQGDFASYKDRVLFYGDKCRGMLMGKRI